MSGGSRSGAIEGRKTISRDVHKKTVRACVHLVLQSAVCVLRLSEARVATLAPFLHSGNAAPVRTTKSCSVHAVAAPP